MWGGIALSKGLFSSKKVCLQPFDAILIVVSRQPLKSSCCTSLVEGSPACRLAWCKILPQPEFSFLCSCLPASHGVHQNNGHCFLWELSQAVHLMRRSVLLFVFMAYYNGAIWTLTRMVPESCSQDGAGGRLGTLLMIIYRALLGEQAMRSL